MTPSVQPPPRGRLLISCPDQPGIVAAVSRFLAERGANIVHSDQHSTSVEGGAFFMRTDFALPDLDARGSTIEREFAADVAERFDMDWRLAYSSRSKKLAIMVSREDHCLLELFWHWRAGDLRAEITMVISNHETLRRTVEDWGIPFHHVPVDREHKDEAELQQRALLDGHADTIVLARYMQIVSTAFIARYPNNIINIHHSFLPAFVGARPYEQAYDRGVKLIGATAHYVTPELDAGPIIEQGVERVDHRHDVTDLRRIGRMIERFVLARAVSWHVDDRVIVHGNKTVVFD